MSPFPRTAAVFHQILPIHRLRERVAYDDACRSASGEFVELPLGRCHFREVGSGEPTVVLVHGFLYSTFMWEPVLQPLGEHFRTVAIDLLGWGYSQRDETRDYDYQLYADQLLQFLDARSVERAALVGQSMGGGTIIRFAVQHPDRVERLILVDAASLPNPTPLVGRIFALPLVGETLQTLGGNAVVAKNLKDFWIHNHELVTPDYVEQVTAPMRIQGSSWTALNILRTLDFGSQEREVEQLAELDIPTLVVWGRQDRAVPLALGEQMHQMLPGSELLIIDEAGHTPHEERPDVFLERAIPFLKGG